MKRIRIKDPVWANQLRDRIIFLCDYEDEDGNVHVVEDSVNKYPDAQGQVHEDWQLIMDEFGVEGLDANLQAIADRQSAISRRGAGAAPGTPPEDMPAEERAAMERSRQQEELFKTKLDAFEMDIVKNADRERKAQIRKATTKTEVYSVIALLMLKAEQESPATPEDSTTSEEDLSQDVTE